MQDPVLLAGQRVFYHSRRTTAVSLLLFSCVEKICHLQCIKGNGERKIHGQLKTILSGTGLLLLADLQGTLTQNSVQIKLTDQLYLTTNFAMNCPSLCRSYLLCNSKTERDIGWCIFRQQVQQYSVFNNESLNFITL